ncbi:glutathione S-transferase family protein [Pseudorhodoplanes sinuspersici]|uniref:Glutathione S-transferase n=1 Tax=Pseudorhodoplanes sinuspersici TaxID=1235591 RepID=A0A1W6ZW07_9HYPH|nr:glutathione S-transferase family protein [Pseudorhodoplanes sinuspersici]ARQ01468.1 glutathione S-transferase [Pseudorhodoplanes sinuspersici]RKE73161.1 glutathione S-transferase [Pseudorhodoplanes sinuspersici]
MADELVLYSNPMSRGRIARWMLEEVGIPYRTEMLDFGVMKSPDYLAINPMGKVPAIKHNGTIVTECAAVCAYLADVFPHAKLAPPLPERGDYYRWLFFASGPLEYAASNRALGFEPPAERQAMMGYGNYNMTLDTLEYAVSANPFIAGNTFSAADVYVGSHIAWGMQFGTIEKRPAFEAYWKKLEHRPAHIRATELDDAAMPAKA